MTQVLTAPETDFSPETIAEMRSWLRDGYWPGLIDPTFLEDWEVVDAVNTRYEGGIGQFLADA